MSSVASIQSQMMMLSPLTYKVSEMKREAETATGELKAAFEALAVEYQRRHDTQLTALLQQLQAVLTPAVVEPMVEEAVVPMEAPPAGE